MERIEKVDVSCKDVKREIEIFPGKMDALAESEQNLPLADRNPKRVLNVKKLWKCNRFGGTL